VLFTVIGCFMGGRFQIVKKPSPISLWDYILDVPAVVDHIVVLGSKPGKLRLINLGNLNRNMATNELLPLDNLELDGLDAIKAAYYMEVN